MWFIQYSSLSLALLSPVLAAVLPSWNSFPGHDPAIDNRTLDEIYAAAKKEGGVLTVLSGGDEIKQGTSTIAAWEARFPDVKLNLTVDVSKYHDSRIDRQFEKTGSDGADVAMLQTLHDFKRWKEAGRLLPYKVANWEEIYSSLKDPSGAFVAISISQFGALVYNSQLLNASDIPNSYAEFVHPAWKGKLVLTYPNDDDAVAYLFSTIINNYGWEWFEALALQDVQWIRGTGQPSDVLAEGNSTRVLTFTSNPTGAQNIATKILNEPRLLWPQSAAIFASTTKPESAKLFLSWMLSEERQQSRASQGSYVPLTGLNSTAGPVWNDLNTGVTQFSVFMQDRASVERWRFQFETTIGTAQGVSPVQSVLGSKP